MRGAVRWWPERGRMGKVCGLLILGLALSACLPGPSAKGPVPKEATAALIPRAALFGNPERAQTRISPRGDFISFLAPLDGYLNVWVAPVDAPEKARAITRDTRRGVRDHFWAENGSHILYLQDEAGDENWRLYSVDVATGARVDLTPLEGVQAQIVGMSQRQPDTVLVGLNDRDKRWHDVYRIDVKTGKRALAQRNAEGFASFIADRDNILRLALKNLPSGAVELWAFNGRGRFAKMMEIPFEDSLTTYPLVFAADGASFLMVDSTGRDKAGLVRVDAETGARTVLGENAKADVSDVMLEPSSGDPLAWGAEYLKLEWTPLREDAKADLALLKERLQGQAKVVSQSADNSRWIVVEDGPTIPASAHLYDRPAGALTKLFDLRPALAKAPLQPMIPVEIAARDGLMLVSYLTLPPGADKDGNGRPDQPLPMTLLVHGGPWSRDSYGLNGAHQWLANRGYAVLSVNFRGSTGFGKAFVNAGNREWAGRMQEDLLDAVAWAEREKIALPEKVAIYGGSYGGYAALVGLTFTPERFACGVSIVGPSNLETLLNSIPPYWESFRGEFYQRVGDPRTAEGKKLLAERSPLFKAERIARPLLIGQGANDPRVKQAESDQIVAAMNAKSLPVTYVVYPDEGHGFGRPQNRMSFNAIAEAFLATCLGGRAEPVGGDFAGASLTVPEGASLVPGLAEALAARGTP